MSDHLKLVLEAVRGWGLSQQSAKDPKCTYPDYQALMSRGLAQHQALLERIHSWRTAGFQAPPKGGVMPSDGPGIAACKVVDAIDVMPVHDAFMACIDATVTKENVKPAISGLDVEWNGDHRLGKFK